MFAWFSDLTARERRTMAACFGGWSLDALDVQIFSFVIPSLLGLWHITTGQAGVLGTITLLVSAFGGWLAGALSDRWGRVRILQITIVWYAFFTFLCGFAQDFNQLFIFRALQGLGFGGEWAAGAVLMGEVIQDRYRGRAVGIVQTGWSIGWGAAALLYTLLMALLPEEYAWRALFWIGTCPGGAGVLDPPLHRGAGNSPQPRGARWLHAHLQRAEAALSLDHLARLHDGRRRTGRRLCARCLAADISEDSAWALRGRHRRLHACADPRRVLRLRHRRLPRRRHRAQADVHAIRNRVHRADLGVSVRADQQRLVPAGWLRAGVCLPDHVLADGLVHDRAVPDRGARRWPGILLQCRPRHRCTVPRTGGLPGHAART